MNRRLAEAIIRYLSFSEEIDKSRDSLGDFSGREWEDTFRWLDNANLALYLLQKLHDTHDDRRLPPAVLSRLEQNYLKNRSRVDEMARAFAEVNEKFSHFGVNYAVVKGFSLVPMFCSDSYLRQQSDIDYLVDAESVPIAEQALADLGFFLKKHKAAAKEWTFAKSSISHSLNSSEQYEGNGRYVVELHLAFWRPDEHGIHIAGTQFSASRTVEREWRGIRFRALPEEEAFLLKVLHTFQHLLTGDARMSWFYEIAYCLQQPNDASFWQHVGRRAEADAVLPQLVAIITELAAVFFQVPLPPIIGAWKANLPPPVKVWLENYGRPVAFEKMPVYEVGLFPASKLVLFLHTQFLPDGKPRRDFLRRRLLPWKQRAGTPPSGGKRPNVLSGLKLDGLLPKISSRWHEEFLFRRVVYHVGSGLRYLCEIPRWWWLNRSNGVQKVPAISPRHEETVNVTGLSQGPRTGNFL